MPKPRMIMALAKVMIAAAWIDESVTNEEINSLKDLLFHLPGMTAHDWAELEIYLETPVAPEERDRLVIELEQALSSRTDRELAISALRDMIQADGDISDREKQVFNEIQSELEQIHTGIFKHMGRAISGPVQRRSEAVSRAPNRELFLDDFIQNKIYYKLKQRLQSDEVKLDLPDEVLRKLSLAGGLMARVAYVDREVTDGEFENMAAAIERFIDLDREAACFVAEMAVSTVVKDLDYYRLSREFFEHTTEDERVRFLDVLFSVAASDGIVSHKEMEEIRNISNMLKLTHTQYIDAKLKIPREQRAY